MQILINILFSCIIYLIISTSFLIIYQTSKFFNIAHAIIITSGAYITFLFTKLTFPILLAIPFAVCVSILLGLSTEQFIFKSLRKRNSHSFVLLIVSLGLYIILQNIISLIGGDDTKSIRTGEIKAGNEILGAHITDIQIITIAVSLLFFIGTILFLNKTKLGKQMRAVSSNEELSKIFGINSDNIVLWSFGIGSSLAAIAGILVALDTDMTPTMGFNLLLYGIVAMIIGGVGSTWGLIGGAFLLAAAQHLGAYYIDSKWMDAIAYIILILFLIWKPLGFSGRRLKKIEI